MKVLVSEQMELFEADVNTKTAKQVIIEAGTSKNNRHYSADLLREAAPLFENIQTYANHPTARELKEMPSRSVTDITGWLSDIRFDETRQALVGTRHFADTTKGRDVWALAEAVVNGRAPSSLLGASIHALGAATKRDDGILEVSQITHALSVDDVTTPSAGGGFDRLLQGGDDIVSVITQDMSYDEWRECRPDYTERLTKHLKQARQEGALKAANEKIETLMADLAEKAKALDEATAAHQLAERALAIESALKEVRLPAQWKADLAERLRECEPAEWERLIQADVDKHKGQPSTVNQPVSEGFAEAATPRDDTPRQRWALPHETENIRDYMQRIRERRDS